MVCALTAAFLMILTGCLQMRDAYRALQGDIGKCIDSIGLAILKEPLQVQGEIPVCW